jgi:hypothetical protein
MRRTACAILAVSAATTSALAEQAPQLPASAKKLTATEIVELYDGQTYSYTSYTRFGVATGIVTYDLRNNKSHGTYKLGWHHGAIDGRIRMDGDRFCYKVGIDREHCDFVYVDGDSVYDVDPDGAVRSVNKRV